jgi:PAS domain S-box-containing protein
VARILIVDNDGAYRNKLADFLAGKGHGVVKGGLTQATTDYVLEEDLDVVLLDPHAGDGDGFLMLEQIHRKKPQLPVVLVASEVTDEDALRALKKGAYDLIKKETTKPELDFAVAKAVECRRLAKENVSLVAELKDQTGKLGRLNDELKRRERELSEAVDELNAVNQIAAIMSSTLDIDRVLRLVLEETRSAMRADAASIVMVDDGEDDLVFRYAIGPYSESLVGRRMKRGEGIVGWAIDNGRPVLVPDVTEDDRFYWDIDAESSFSSRSLLCVPLKFKDRVLGAIEIVNRQDGTQFTPRDEAFLTSICKQAAVVIENARLYSEIEVFNRQLRERTEDQSQQLAELRYFSESVIQGMNSGLMTIDLDSSITSVNRAAVGILKAPEEKLVGRPLRELLTARYQILFSTERIAAGVVKLEDQLEFVPENGDPILVGFSLSPRRDREGNVVGAILIFRDLSDLRKLRENMRHMDRLASMGELTAGIAHEIRNPLAGIKTIAQALKGEMAEDDPKVEYLERIIKEINRINQLLQDFFAFARPQRPRFITVDPRQVVERVVELLTRNLEEARIQVVRQYAGVLPNIQADPNQLHQVVLNLFINAIQAMTDGGVLRLGLSADNTQDPPMVVLNVSDTGSGMTDDVRVKIFDPFFTTKPSGTGLGLSVTFKVVAEHHGFINVDSKPDEGTTVKVSLPLTQPR